MPGMDGLELLSSLKTDSRTQHGDVVLITGHGDMTTAVEALRKGAYDYLNKPINARELSAVVDRCAEHQALMRENSELKRNMDQQVDLAAAGIRKYLESMRHRLREVEGIGLVIAESPAMIELLREALILHAEPSVPVLIEGETGTGKEVMARYIHHGESVVETPFMAINCAAIPHELFESELFGHEPGAFTGSRAEGAPGKLEQAGKGSLFLDEVAEMPLSLQPKLLRVLEERSFYRVGGVKKRRFDARIVCAGNRNMADMVERGAFRRDLYHRLRVGHLLIPPLRERQKDILPLAEHFLRREAVRKKKRFHGLAPETVDILHRYPWPGNVRELENTIERAVLMHDGEELLPRHISFLSSSLAPAYVSPPRDSVLGNDTLAANAFGAGGLLGGPAVEPFDCTRPDAVVLPDRPINLDALVDSIMHAAVERFDGNKTKAAEFLGISRFALHRRLQQKNGKS
jgi:DNA-binding NtrC family response regulator